jgi:hypothetical protein
MTPYNIKVKGTVDRVDCLDKKWVISVHPVHPIQGSPYFNVVRGRLPTAQPAQVAHPSGQLREGSA